MKWLYSLDDVAPLISYTNSVRNSHNRIMTQDFAAATGQEFAVYYSEDTVGAGKNRTVLRAQNVRDA
jgi:hypothetical protein